MSMIAIFIFAGVTGVVFLATKKWKLQSETNVDF